MVLQLSSEEFLEDNINVLDIVDNAVANQVGIIVLNGGGASGGKLYEAACLLKSVIRERAYLIIDERVDIAAAVNASGVLLSDQGHFTGSFLSFILMANATSSIFFNCIVHILVHVYL